MYELERLAQDVFFEVLRGCLRSFTSGRAVSAETDGRMAARSMKASRSLDLQLVVFA
jgi:hypothetical protein